MLARLREDPATTTAAVLERWRDRPEHASLARLAAGECLVPDARAAASELRSALARLAGEQAEERLHVLEGRARDLTLSDEEKAELQALLRARVQSTRRSGPN
jgi:hypothetical protein